MKFENHVSTSETFLKLTLSSIDKSILSIFSKSSFNIFCLQFDLYFSIKCNNIALIFTSFKTKLTFIHHIVKVFVDSIFKIL